MAQAQFVKEALDLTNVEFRKLDLYDLSADEVGTFDVVLCFGILYHLEDPVRGMKVMSELCTHAMLVDTALLSPRFVARFLRKRPLWRMEVVGVGKEKAKTTNRGGRVSRCSSCRPSAPSSSCSPSSATGTPNSSRRTKDLQGRYYKYERGTFLAVR